MLCCSGEHYRVIMALLFFFFFLPALVAQLDARPTGDQEVAGLTPAGLATFFGGY